MIHILLYVFETAALLATDSSKITNVTVKASRLSVSVNAGATIDLCVKITRRIVLSSLMDLLIR